MANEVTTVEMTADGLRLILFEELELLRSGKIDATRSRATANLARQIIESIRVQVQFGKVLTDMKTLDLVNAVPRMSQKRD